MKKGLNRGFTLIELLVVIAIIGILSSVVLASLNTARSKGSDAAVKANMNGIRSQAEIVYDTDNGSYDNVCADGVITKQLDAASQAGAGNATTDVCNDASGAWAASAPLKSAGFWCVDSTGSSRSIAATLGSGVTVCPAS
jgi:prepilin-type N-terminal cleavage/methylation domain-containing protein